ncbi:MAG: lysylphosphatidylglycerol synthase domain-containing protein [Candidatus Binatia bacterium]|nr:lysylphosphatidylglycerol synthase domain-containing protein [Candidatus Binatia bacterium]
MSKRAPAKADWTGFATRVLPWALAAFVLWYLLQQIPLDEAIAAFGRADLSLLLPAAVLCVVVWFWIDSFALSYIYTRFNAPLPPREARSVRALTYLLAVLNWNLGTGGIILHMRHAKGVPFIEALSTMLLYNLIDLVILAGLVLFGSLLLPADPGLESIRIAMVFVLAVPLAILTVFISGWKPGWAWLRGILELRVFHSHRLATWRDVFIVLGLRGTYFSVFVLFFALALPAFGADVPWFHLVATVPPVLLIGTLPITPAGLGTQQAAVVYFYRSFAPEAELLALGFLLSFVFILMRVPVSFFYLGDLAALRAEIAAGRDDEDT